MTVSLFYTKPKKLHIHLNSIKGKSDVITNPTFIRTLTQFYLIAIKIYCKRIDYFPENYVCFHTLFMHLPNIRYVETLEI